VILKNAKGGSGEGCTVITGTPGRPTARAATELEPARSRYGYVYAVAFHSSDQLDQSMKVLRENLVRHPGDRDTLLSLATLSRDAGDIGTALQYAEQLKRTGVHFAGKRSNDRDLARLTDDLRARLKQQRSTSISPHSGRLLG